MHSKYALLLKVIPMLSRRMKENVANHPGDSKYSHGAPPLKKWKVKPAEETGNTESLLRKMASSNTDGVWFCAPSGSPKQCTHGVTIAEENAAYFFGGFQDGDQDEPDMQSQRLDLQTMKWSDPDIEGCSPDRAGAACVAFGSIVYLFGGESVALRETLDDFHCVDLSVNNPRWEPVTEELTRRLNKESNLKVENVSQDEEDKDTPVEDEGTDSNDNKNEEGEDVVKEIVSKSERPPARRFLCASQTSDDTFVIHGGLSATGEYLGDTWCFNRKTGKWSEFTGGGAPSPRAHHSAAYLPACAVAVFFGGRNSNGVLGDLFVFEPNGSGWSSPQSTGTSPSPRCWHTTVCYNGPNEDDDTKILVFGGCDASGMTDASLFTWQRTTCEWKKLNVVGNKPSARMGHACVLVPGKERTLFFGGSDGKTRTDEAHLLSTSVAEVTKETERASGFGTVEFSNGQYQGFFKPGTTNTPHGQGKMTYKNGDIYEGNWASGERAGVGTLRFANGDKYTGAFKGDEIVGHGDMRYANTDSDGVCLVRYEGIFFTGVRDGDARAEYSDGSVYYGRFKSGVRCGEGSITYKNGSEYDGLWKLDMQNGQGWERDKDGNRYRGNFMDGKRNGNGRCDYLNGDTYVGSWASGMRNGKGNFESATGEKYSGKWLRDKREGFGECFYTTGHRYKGMWSSDMRDGNGMQQYVSGAVFEGSWKEDMRSGSGTETSATGDVYEGEWKADAKHGEGRTTFSSGDVHTGMYANGQANGSGKLVLSDGEYEGHFENGAFGGNGTLSNKEGVYTGGWKNGKRHGTGKMVYKQPSVVGDKSDARGEITAYDGEWKDGKRHGSNSVSTLSDGSTFQCQWKNDLKIEQAIEW
eukprot:g6344.t1